MSDQSTVGATETNSDSSVDHAIQAIDHISQEIELSHGRVIHLSQDPGHDRLGRVKKQEDAARITENTITIADGVSQSPDGALASTETVEIAGNTVERESDMLLAALITARDLSEKFIEIQRKKGHSKDILSTVVSYKIIEEDDKKYLTGISMGDSLLQVIRNGEIIQVNQTHDFHKFYGLLVVNRLKEEGFGMTGSIINPANEDTIIDMIQTIEKSGLQSRDLKDIVSFLRATYTNRSGVCNIFSSKLVHLGVSDDVDYLNAGYLSLEGLISIVKEGDIEPQDQYKLVLDFVRDNLTFKFELQEGDTIILNTDGLDLPESKMTDIVTYTDPQSNLSEQLTLVQLAATQGRYQDNITVITQKV